MGMRRSDANRLIEEVVTHLEEAVRRLDELSAANEISDGMVDGREPFPTEPLAVRLAALDMISVFSDHNEERLKNAMREARRLRAKYNLDRQNNYVEPTEGYMPVGDYL